MPVNRPTYAEACRTFRWEDSFKALEWAPAGDVNLGHTILDRHAGAERVALHWFGKDGAHRDYAFDELETGKIRRFLLRQQ